MWEGGGEGAGAGDRGLELVLLAPLILMQFQNARLYPFFIYDWLNLKCLFFFLIMDILVL